MSSFEYLRSATTAEPIDKFYLGLRSAAIQAARDDIIAFNSERLDELINTFEQEYYGRTVDDRKLLDDLPETEAEITRDAGWYWDKIGTELSSPRTMTLSAHYASFYDDAPEVLGTVHGAPVDMRPLLGYLA